MKKILSVALSTAMAFSMFASVAFGQAGLTDVNAQYNYLKEKGIFSGYPDQQAHLDRQMTRAEFAKVITKTLGLKEITGVYSFKDKNYNAKHWAAPFVEAVSAAGIMEGKNTTKKLFDLSGAVTVQEMATVLVRALDLEVPTETNNSATAWAKGYVQAAINAGLVDANSNFQANASRELLVKAAYAVDQEISLQVKSYTVSESGKVVEFKMSDDETVKVTLDKALEANKETEVKFTYKDKEFTEKVTYVVVDATKVVSVSANNLKEVTISFDGKVDKNTAQDAGNYDIVKTDGGATQAISSAVLSQDGKSVKLTLADSVVFKSQEEYKLSFNNIKAGSNVLNVTDYKFSPVDAALPTVTGVEALGNKTLKVTFSEPVQSAPASSFVVDGNPLTGYTTVNGSTVIVKFYTALTNGEHAVTVNNVVDYAGFKSNSQEFKFNVVEDTQAPTVSVESASFEKVTLKFSEPVDPTTVLGSNVYWLQGTTKQYANSTVNQISDDTYEFDFTGKEIRYTTDLFVTNVKDYSGNTIAADTKVAVSPVVDQTRPEVVNATIADDNKTITVKFSKDLKKSSAETSANYVIKDADGKEVSKLKYPVLSDNKTVKITLAQALSQGSKYTIAISGVSDNTTLQNVMLPYSKEITVGDTTGPKVDEFGSYDVSNGNNKLVISFDEKVATSGNGSAVDAGKYLIQVDGVWKALPSGSYVNVTPDGKAVVITLPSSLKADSVSTIRVASITDIAGNALQGLTQDVKIKVAAASVVQSVYATDNDTIKLTFDQTLLEGSASPADYKVSNGTSNLTVISSTVSGKTVTLKLADNTKLTDASQFDAKDVTVSTIDRPSTSSQSGVAIQKIANQKVGDQIKADVSSVEGSETGKTLTITFNEALTTELDANAKTDLVIKDADGNILNGYSVKAEGTALVVTFDKEQSGVLSVSVQNPRFIKDANANVVNETSAIEVLVKTK